MKRLLPACLDIQRPGSRSQKAAGCRADGRSDSGSHSGSDSRAGGRAGEDAGKHHPGLAAKGALDGILRRLFGSLSHHLHSPRRSQAGKNLAASPGAASRPVLRALHGVIERGKILLRLFCLAGYASQLGLKVLIVVFGFGQPVRSLFGPIQRLFRRLQLLLGPDRVHVDGGLPLVQLVDFSLGILYLLFHLLQGFCRI